MLQQTNKQLAQCGNVNRRIRKTNYDTKSPINAKDLTTEELDEQTSARTNNARQQRQIKCYVRCTNINLHMAAGLG